MPSPSLPRQAPSPIPAIHPVPEYRVDGERRQVYEEMKAALQVPWMGVVTMAYAHYPNFFGTLWDGLRSVVPRDPFVRHCRELRAMTEEAARGLAGRSLLPRLADKGYAPRELDQIRQVVETFSHGNFPYLLIATIVRLLLEGEDAAGPAWTEPVGDGEVRTDAVSRASLVLMEGHHADATTAALYDDIRQTLGLPFVNTDYRALARWPSYFALAWGDLKPVVRSAGHVDLCETVHREALRRVARELPLPATLSSARLRAAALRDAPEGEVLQVARLFQWLLPGLVTNVAILRAQIEEVPEPAGGGASMRAG